jgi:succinate dehydrogenase / fumarate reductase, membrane anchor subunit
MMGKTHVTVLTYIQEKEKGFMLRISTGHGPRPTNGGFETFSWYYFRATGVILLLMVLVHLYIMHISNDVSCTTYAFVAMRYSNIFWRVFDWILLTVALTHGMNGLRVVVDDYVHKAATRMWVMTLLVVLLVVFFMLGTIALIIFPMSPSVLGVSGCITK